MIDDTKAFLSRKFAQYPDFSFGDGRIMFDHSLLVHKLACELAQGLPVNRLVLELSALLHDIGKACAFEYSTLGFAGSRPGGPGR